MDHAVARALEEPPTARPVRKKFRKAEFDESETRSDRGCQRRREWTFDEDKLLVVLQAVLGNQWTKIASHIPGHCDRQCRARFSGYLAIDTENQNSPWTASDDALVVRLRTRELRTFRYIASELKRSEARVKSRFVHLMRAKGKHKYVIDTSIDDASSYSHFDLGRGESAHPEEEPTVDISAEEVLAMFEECI